MAVTRVYILAKELEVSSAAIIKKCEDEGIPNIKNHMSVISAGLAATIREWFSEGDNVTTVETGEKVNLEKVRIKKKKKAAEEKPEEPAEVQQPEPQIEQPVQQEEPQPEIIQPQPEVVKPVEPQVVVPLPQPVVEPVKPAPKPKPKPIVPAGPMLSKPEPAKLSGPTVVRVEAPEPERQRGPARGPALRKPPRRDFTAAEPAAKDPLAAEIAEREHAGKKKHKEKAHGKKDEFDSEETKRAKYDFQRRQRDIEERRVRLNAVSGAGMRVRPVRKITDKSHKDAPALVAGATAATPTQASIAEPIQVKDLSAVLAVKASDIIYKLMKQGRYGYCKSGN